MNTPDHGQGVPRPPLPVTRWWVLVALGMGLAVLLGYHRALGLGLLADDLVLLTQARGQLDLGLFFAVDPVWIFHRPFVQLLWLAIERLAGSQPWPYHALGLVAHWLNSLLVVALALRLAPAARLLAAGAGLLFALSPLHIETVAWAASLYDLFAALFYLMALLLLLAFWRRGGWPTLAAALLAYQLCLWSKETAFTWPLMALLVAAAVPERPRWRRVGLSLAPFLALLGLNLAQRLVTWGNLGGYQRTQRDLVATFWDHGAGAVAQILVPLNELLWPDVVFQVWWLLAAALVLAGLLTLRRRRLFLFGLAWLLVSLVPVLKLLPLGPGLEAARLLYLPAIGAAIALATLLEGLAEALAAALPRLRPGPIFGALVALVGLAYLVVLQVHFQPWQVATRVVDALPARLHALVNDFAPGTTLEVAGLPRVYRGAQVFNLGFDHAFQQRHGAWFDLRLAKDRDHFSPASGDHFWLTFGEDSLREGWAITDLAGILAPDRDLGAGGRVLAVWGPGDCGDWQDWTVLGAEAVCTPGQGLRLQPQASDAGLVSPGFELPAGHWLRVAVDLAAQPPPADEASLQVFWHSPADWFDETRSRRLRLATDPETRRYLVFVPPTAGAAAPNQIRIDPTDGNHPVRVERVELRAIAP